MAKGDQFYFDTLKQSAQLSKRAASYLVTCFEAFDHTKIDTMLKEMHEIEHQADNTKHEMSHALAKAFVTPIDREDLNLLIRTLDDVTDKLEEVLQKLYIYDIRTVTPDSIAFATKLAEACTLLCQIMDEFEAFKKSKKLHEQIILLNDLEEECDALYLKAMRELNQSEQDALIKISWREIYECLEACADTCEHVSEEIEAVVMKNT